MRPQRLSHSLDMGSDSSSIPFTSDADDTTRLHTSIGQNSRILVVLEAGPMESRGRVPSLVVAVALLIDRTCKAFIRSHGSKAIVDPIEHTSA